MDGFFYSVQNRVEEFPEIKYNDGVKKLFLYTDGRKGGSDTLRNLLQYIRNSKEENAVDDELKKLHSNVERLKSNKRIGVKYMQLQEAIMYQVKEEVEEALKEALEEAKKGMREEVRQEVAEEVRQKVAEEVEQRMAKLTEILLNDEKYEDLKRVAKDKKYREKLYEEYHII